jgi:hypothetical protein
MNGETTIQYVAGQENGKLVAGEITAKIEMSFSEGLEKAAHVQMENMLGLLEEAEAKLLRSLED